MSTPADNLDSLNSDKLASAIANSGERIASVIAAADEVEREAASLQSRAIPPSFLGDAPAPPLRRRRSWLAVKVGIVMLMVPVVVGVVAVGQWSFPGLWQQAADRPVELASSGLFRVEAPRLLVQPSRATSAEPAFLGLILQGRADDAVVMITGLVSGMTVSMGAQIGVDTWQVPATDLPGAWIGPPTNFVGVVDLVAELHLADKTIADRRPLKLEWGAAIPATAAASPTVETDQTAVTPPREQDVAPSRQLDADEPMMEAHRTDRTAIALPQGQNVGPPRQLGTDEPTVEAHRTDRTAVALPQEQNVAPPRQLGADEPMVESDRTAVVPPGEQNVGSSPQLRVDEPTVETHRIAIAPPGEQNVAPSRQLDAHEIAALLKHGENLIRNGDLAAARLVLQRAAEAKSAEAALTLAATYDPVILRELRVYGFVSDVGMARSWYEKAQEFGSAAASQRLEILISAAR
jgi:hypothetical protein